MAPRGIVIEVIGDERSYVRAAANTIATNTKLDASFKTVGVNAKLSADAQIAAAVKASEALRVNAVQLSSAATKLPAGTGRDAALVAAAAAQDKYNRSIGVSTLQTRALSGASQTAERDLGKATRGLVAGASAGLGLGRSLAFASGGFLAFAGGATLIRNSITDAEALQKAHAGLDVAITKTGGSVAKLGPQYAATAKNAAQFGINEADATTGLERATVLTGSAAKAQRAYQEALVISKATGKDFNTVLTATSKGQEGVTTSLQRYGILIPKGTAGTAQFVTVMGRFSGQAKANTTDLDRFNAILQNSEEIIGTDLLPTVDKYAGELGDWLQKMDRSGRLQKDVNSDLRVAGDLFHTVGTAVGIVDKATGSFANTLKILAAFKFASLVTGWIGNLEALAVKWGLVSTAATEAGAAEAGAGAAGVAGGAAAGGASRIILPAGVAAGAAGAARGSLLGGLGKFALAGVGAFTLGDAGNELGSSTSKNVNGWMFYSFDHGKNWTRGQYVGFPTVITPQLRHLGGNIAPAFFPSLTGTAGRTSTSTGPFGTAKPLAVYKTFSLTVPEQLAQAQAALTKGNADDVAAAKALVARIKRLIDEGHLSGASLLQALQSEASAYSTIWSAEDAAAQKRAAAAQAAKAKLQAQIENSIDPIRLQVALAREQSLGQDSLHTLIKMKRAAEEALASGNLSLQQQLEAYNDITSLNQQIAAEKKRERQKLDAATNQFKQASTSALTANLGLTDAQRRELKARLSQLGPGGTRPRHGTGAYGYDIGSDGRPIHVHTTVKLDGKPIAKSTTKHQQRRHGRNSSQRRGPNAGTNA